MVLASILLAGVMVEDIEGLRHGKFDGIQAHVHAHLAAFQQLAQRMLPAIAPLPASRLPPACNISYSPLPGQPRPCTLTQVTKLAGMCQSAWNAVFLSSFPERPYCSIMQYAHLVKLAWVLRLPHRMSQHRKK